MKRLDLAGQRFGMLVAVGVWSTPGKKSAWTCQCDCGKQSIVTTTHLRTGHTQSCGCLMSEAVAQRNKANAKHGMWTTPEWSAWRSMLKRCYNQKDKRYPDYGGRGISVCDEWRHDFSAFYKHIGARPTPRHSLDRICNADGYRPGNVRWATDVEQNNNRRSNVTAIVDGAPLTVAQIAQRHGLQHSTVLARVRAGKTGAALTAPSRRA